jgi:2-haloacid dehalogenase
MIKNIIFDIGAVLVDWDPRYYYRRIMKDEAEVEKFLTEICTFEFNHSLDLGRPWDDARAELVSKYPEYTTHIDAYWNNWLDMFSGPIHGTVDILKDLKSRGFPVYALSNWNDVTFQVALREFPFLNLFDGRIVSGEVKVAKPDPRIYQLLLDTYKLIPHESLFIDDRKDNIDAASVFGIKAVQFISPEKLHEDLIAYGIYER